MPRIILVFREVTVFIDRSRWVRALDRLSHISLSCTRAHPAYLFPSHQCMMKWHSNHSSASGRTERSKIEGIGGGLRRSSPSKKRRTSVYKLYYNYRRNSNKKYTGKSSESE